MSETGIPNAGISAGNQDLSTLKAKDQEVFKDDEVHCNPRQPNPGLQQQNEPETVLQKDASRKEYPECDQRNAHRLEQGASSDSEHCRTSCETSMPDLIRETKEQLRNILVTGTSGQAPSNRDSSVPRQDEDNASGLHGRCECQETIAKEPICTNYEGQPEARPIQRNSEGDRIKSEGRDDQGKNADEDTKSMACPVEPGRDPDRRRSEGPGDQGQREDGGDNVFPIRENTPVQDQAVPVPIQELEKTDEKRIEDTFEEVSDNFASFTEFQKFARSGKGLRLSEEEITNIVGSKNQISEKKIEMLELWQQYMKDQATSAKIKEIVARYCEYGSAVPNKAEPNEMQSQNLHEDCGDQEVHPVRLEDVFQHQIIPAFASVAQFRKFARSGKGLCLDGQLVREISSNNRQDAHNEKMELLKLWRQKTEDPTPEKITQLKDQYLEGLKNRR